MITLHVAGYLHAVNTAFEVCGIKEKPKLAILVLDFRGKYEQRLISSSKYLSIEFMELIWKRIFLGQNRVFVLYGNF